MRTTGTEVLEPPGWESLIWNFFGYLETIELNTRTLYSFTRSIQEKLGFVHDHRG